MPRMYILHIYNVSLKGFSMDTKESRLIQTRSQEHCQLELFLVEGTGGHHQFGIRMAGKDREGIRRTTVISDGELLAHRFRGILAFVQDRRIRLAEKEHFDNTPVKRSLVLDEYETCGHFIRVALSRLESGELEISLALYHADDRMSPILDDRLNPILYVINDDIEALACDVSIRHEAQPNVIGNWMRRKGKPLFTIVERD